MSSIGERIRELRGALSLEDLSEKLGVHKNTVSNYEKGTRPPDIVILIKLLNIFPDTNPEWLLTGKSRRYKENREPDNRFIRFTDLEAEAISGPDAGSRSAQIADYMTFKEDWVVNHLLVSPKYLGSIFLLAIKGDGMSPTLNEGDFALVDTSDRDIAGSGIYVIKLGESLAVKRLQKRLDLSVRIMNDNPIYESESLSKEAAEKLDIVGRVLWSGGKI